MEWWTPKWIIGCIPQWWAADQIPTINNKLLGMGPYMADPVADLVSAEQKFEQKNTPRIAQIKLET